MDGTSLTDFGGLSACTREPVIPGEDKNSGSSSPRTRAASGVPTGEGNVTPPGSSTHTVGDTDGRGNGNSGNEDNTGEEAGGSGDGDGDTLGNENADGMPPGDVGDSAACVEGRNNCEPERDNCECRLTVPRWTPATTHSSATVARTI